MDAVEAKSALPGIPGPETGDEAARKRAVVETYARHEGALRRTARRYSLCADDADEALQRSLEILLRKAPTMDLDPRELVKWTQTVVKHEAMAVRRDRERILAGPAAIAPELADQDWIDLLPTPSDGPPERAERREAIARSREALQALKPQELRALTLLAEGYSYLEIGEITGYSRTKVNRCLAEGRERFRRLISSGEDGSRCREMRPLLSAFCDGEATPEQADRLREHLRACAYCRATLRAYRAAPAAARALVPLVPLERSLLERAQDAAARIGDWLGGGGEALSVPNVGAGGAGAATLAKAAVVCVGAAGGVTAGIATGVVPSPLDAETDRFTQVTVERQAADVPAETRSVPKQSTPRVEARATSPHPRGTDSQPQLQQAEAAVPAPAESVSEPVPESSSEPAPESSTTVEPAPPPAPAPEPEPVPTPSSSGSPAGEFGP
jgi:RNA polymerase sigma factor (sigma-70 family)